MKQFITLLLFGITIVSSLKAQKDDIPLFLKTTYPIDSCIYFMDPFNLRVNQKQTLSGGMLNVRVSFQSSAGSNPDFTFQGTGRFIINPDLLPTGVSIEIGNRLIALFSLPDDIHDPDSPWSGSNLPFPVVLSGFLQKIGATTLDPPFSLALQTIQFEVISLVD